MSINDSLGKWKCIIKSIFRDPIEFDFNKKQLLVSLMYAIIVIFYSKIYNIHIIGQIYLFIYGGAILLFYYYLGRDVFYYKSFYNSLKASEKLVSEDNTENKLRQSDVNDFYINFNKFRNRFKQRLASITSILLTHDYMLDHTFRSIDMFFDITVQAMLNKKERSLMFDVERNQVKNNIQFKNSEKESKHRIEISNIPVDTKNKLIEKDITLIDYKFINLFLQSFRDEFINKPKPKIINIVYVREFFDSWNYILSLFEPEICEESISRINKYYTKKEQRYESLIVQTLKIIELVFANIIAIAVSVIVYYMINTNF